MHVLLRHEIALKKKSAFSGARKQRYIVDHAYDFPKQSEAFRYRESASPRHRSLITVDFRLLSCVRSYADAGELTIVHACDWMRRRIRGMRVTLQSSVNVETAIVNPSEAIH